MALSTYPFRFAHIIVLLVIKKQLTIYVLIQIALN